MPPTSRGKSVVANLLTILFLLGTIDRRANATGALFGMFCGLAVILYVFKFTTVAFSWYVMIGSIVTFVVGAATSRVIGGKAMATE